MSHLVRVYHPETDELFEVPQSRANELILVHGWRQQPLVQGGEPAVQTVEPAAETDVIDVGGDEDEAPVRPRRR